MGLANCGILAGRDSIRSYEEPGRAERPSVKAVFNRIAVAEMLVAFLPKPQEG